MKQIFSLDDIVLEFESKNSNIYYCVKNNCLFKCKGGFKDYHLKQFVPVSIVKIDFVLSSTHERVKKLALDRGLHVLSWRQMNKNKV